MWVGQEDDPNRTWSVTAADGSFLARVPNGSYTIDVYAEVSEECTLVGWYGPGGFTTNAAEIVAVEVEDQDIQGIEVKLPNDPENLPHIGPCAS